MAEPLILSLEECRDPRLVGGKAAGLAKLRHAGFAVPEGFCVTTVVYRRCLGEAGILAADAWKKVLQSPDTQRAQEQARVQRILQGQPWPAGFQADLDLQLRKLTHGPSSRWAVRSSATNEDAEQASAAGLYRTGLGVSSKEVQRAIRDCWVSLWDERAFQYLLRSNYEPLCPAMAVVIQPMLDALTAGVAYSIQPMTGRTSQVTINAVPGLASSLVNGEVVPDQYVVEVKEDDLQPLRIRRRILAQKRQKLVAGLEGVQAEPIPALEQWQSSLSDEELFTLSRLAKEIETALRHPVDLEWVWDAERLWVVQARRITGVQPSTILTNDECEWTRANFKETMPELPSPLGISSLVRFMDAYMINPYRRLGCRIPEGLSSVRVLHGRPYLNVTLFYLLVVQLHGDPASLIEQMGGEPVIFTPSVRPLGGFALARAGLLMMREWRKATSQGPRNFVAMREMAKTYHPDHIRSLSVQELAETLDRLGRWLDAHEVTFGIVAGVAQGLQAMGTFLPGWLGRDWRELLNASLQGQGTVISALQIVWLAELVEIARGEPETHQWFLREGWMAEGFREALRGTEFLRRFEQYLAEYGHRAVGESDVMSPRIADQPDAVLAALKTQVRAGEVRSPKEILSSQTRRREAAFAEIRRRFGWRCYRWAVFQWWYRRLSRFCALREANRHHLMYYSMAARHLLLCLGERMMERGLLTRREDVFYLTLEEQTAIGESPSRDWQKLVEERREERLRNKDRQVPDTIRDWETVVEQNAQLNERGTDGVLRGIAISAGVATGPVRIIRSAEDWKRVQAGDILIVPVIDPGMVSLFGVAAGLVAEMGGTLSHGAIIAREYGLPALVNVPHATSLLRDNEQVQIVSATGLVSRLCP